MKQDIFQVGYIARTIGLKGELGVKLQPGSPLPKKEILLEVKGEKVAYKVLQLSARSKGVTMLKLQGIDTVEKAEELIGTHLFLSLETLPASTGKDFYTAEVLGFSVVDKEHGELGPLSDVLEYPQQRIFQVKQNFKEILIPAIPEFIEKIDRDNKVIYVDTPGGLLDIYLGTSSPDEEE